MDSKTSEQWSGILKEFLQAAIHSILYTRNIYPHGVFQLHKKYQVPVKICMHDGVQSYIDSVLDSIAEILNNGGYLQRVCVCIRQSIEGVETTLERFVFDLQTHLSINLNFSDLVSLEQSFRSALLKIYCCTASLSTLPDDCSWSVELFTNQLTFLALQEKQLIDDMMWISVSDLVPAQTADRRYSIVPVTSVNCSALQIQLYVEDMT